MRRTRDIVISVLSLALLLAILVAVDGRLRDYARGLVNGTPSSFDAVRVGQDVRNVATVMVVAAKNQSVEHAPLVIFSSVAVVLMLFMLKT